MYRCPDALARLCGGAEAPQLRGEVRFCQERGRVLVVAEVAGLPQGGPGFFALHIHEDGHYNPKDVPHPLHAGDLPPLLRYGDRAFLAVRTDRFRVQEIIGKTVVIHANPDDFRSQSAGNAGPKIACGVIGRK